MSALRFLLFAVLGNFLLVSCQRRLRVDDFENREQWQDAARCRKMLHEFSDFPGHNGSVQQRKLSHVNQVVGAGWDNLLNVPMAAIFDVGNAFENCKSTADGRFVLQDHIKSTNLKKITYDRVAQYFANYEAYFNGTADSINLEPTTNRLKIPVYLPGAFSAEFQEAKRRFGDISDSIGVFRSRIRYLAYAFSLHESAHLSANFKHRLAEIIRVALDHENVTCAAEYMAQMLIRDFGTHYVSGVTMGAEIGQDDYVDVTSHKSDKDAMAKLSQISSDKFSKAIKLPPEYNVSNTTPYLESLRSSVVFKKGSMNVDSILDPHFFPDEIEVLDRSGDLLYLLINQHQLEDNEIPMDMMPRLADLVKNATLAYFKKNVNGEKAVEHAPYRVPLAEPMDEQGACWVATSQGGRPSPDSAGTRTTPTAPPPLRMAQFYQHY